MELSEPMRLLILLAGISLSCVSCTSSEGCSEACGQSTAGNGGASGGALASGGSTSAGGSVGAMAGAGTQSGGAPTSGGAPSAGSTSGGASTGGGAGALGGAGAASTSGGATASGGIAGGGGSARSAGASGAAGAGSGRFPFPQNQRSSRCTYPEGVTAADARRAYETWKSEIVTAEGAGGHLRVRRPNSPGGEVNSTVSEGIAYGMMLAVLMGDQPLFDGLWKYSQLWLDGNGLMHWYINAAGTQVLGSGAATDADEDIAWSLILASRQWGGSGSLSMTYLDLAKSMIDKIWKFEVAHDHQELLLPGDTWAGNVIFNPSYFAPNEYRVFGVVSGNVAGWNQVIQTGYTVLEKSLNAQSGNATNGLVPAWCDINGVPKEPFAGGPTNYQYDSARMPFRIGVDYCISGEPRAAAYLAKISGFFAGVGAGAIVDGYDLNGMPRPDAATPAGSPQSAVFVGSAAVGAMHDAKFQSFINDASTRVATGQLLARSRYYNLSWTALNLLMLTGNFVEFSN